jgi:hypothetical protein
MPTIRDLIEKNERDIALFRDYIAVLTAKQGPRQYIGDLRRRIADAQRSNTILRAAR